MTIKHLVIAAATLAGLAGGAGVAAAQSTTSGAIQGTVTDASSGEVLPGVTIVASAPVLQNNQTALSDENGFYKISELPPGDYKITFYFNKAVVERSGITVGVNKTTPVFQAIKDAMTGGEIVKIIDSAPSIDPTSTTQGITLDKNYLKNIPIPGRTFESALGAAAGSQNDGLGVSFSGSSSLENQYVVDGINTTGLTFGTVGSPVINDFIEEIEVITGGYNAEYGRATGGVVNVVTKTGSNELKGSVFVNYEPGFLTAPAQLTPRNSSSIDATTNKAFNADIGAEVGGPIIKDRLWYLVGFAPQLSRVDMIRTTKRQTDCRQVLANGQLSGCDARLFSQGGYADSQPDIDPKTGFFITDTLDNEVRTNSTQAYAFLGKLNFAATPDNQLQLTVSALPQFITRPGIFGLASTGVRVDALTTDVSSKWTTKVNDNKTEIEGVIGWHRDHINVNGYDAASENQPLQGLTSGSLGLWGPGFGSESQATIDGCRDSTVASADAYPFLANNCPMNNNNYYAVGGPGAVARNTEQRVMANAALTQRVKALGTHEIKGGFDVETNRDEKSRLYSGGAFIQNFVGQGDIKVTRWVQLKGKMGSPQAMENTDPRFDNLCTTPDHSAGAISGGSATYLCDFLGGSPGDPGTTVEGNTFNWSGYLRDSWQILPNLTLNAGIRYEEQRMRYASFLQHTTDPLTSEQLGKNALTLQNMWAPRLGLMYDWTQEGRSKVFASWGRFYESIPLDINDRSFGGEVQFVQDFSGCGVRDMRIGGSNGASCLDSNQEAAQERLIGASGVLVAPGIKPQYLDEVVIGAEYEVLDDLKVGLSYQNRRLGRVIEDVSTDGADTYLIANPGEWSASEEAKLAARVAATEEPTEKARLADQQRMYQGIRVFDKPRRDYNAVQLTVTRRFSRDLYVQGSYTYSRLSGNYPGLVSYESGQVDPNISSQYDLIELLANREGPLPQDRPHQVKIDGYYTLDFGAQGALTIGARGRAFSGVPESALAAHYLYGANESYLLPRGSIGRTPAEHALDIRVVYRRKLNDRMELGVYASVFNIYNNQSPSAIDNTYAPSVSLSGQPQNANPVSGGSYEDLIWVKQINDKGEESQNPIGRNPNFRNPTARYTPAYGQVGAQLTF